MKKYFDFLVVVVFFFSTTAFYHYYESWTVVDSLLFVITTITTVGWGYFTPTDDVSRGVTIFVMIFGILCVFYYIIDLIRWLFKVCRKRCIPWYSRRENIWSMFTFSSTLLAFVLFAGTTWYIFVEGDTFITSLYWATQTSTTVGYGDIPIKHPATRWFSIFYCLISTVLVAIIFQNLLSIVDFRERKKERQRLLRCRRSFREMTFRFDKKAVSFKRKQLKERHRLRRERILERKHRKRQQQQKDLQHQQSIGLSPFNFLGSPLLWGNRWGNGDSGDLSVYSESDSDRDRSDTEGLNKGAPYESYGVEEDEESGPEQVEKTRYFSGSQKRVSQKLVGVGAGIRGRGRGRGRVEPMMGNEGNEKEEEEEEEEGEEKVSGRSYSPPAPPSIYLFDRTRNLMRVSDRDRARDRDRDMDRDRERGREVGVPGLTGRDEGPRDCIGDTGRRQPYSPGEGGGEEAPQTVPRPPQEVLPSPAYPIVHPESKRTEPPPAPPTNPLTRSLFYSPYVRSTPLSMQTPPSRSGKWGVVGEDTRASSGAGAGGGAYMNVNTARLRGYPTAAPRIGQFRWNNDRGGFGISSNASSNSLSSMGINTGDSYMKPDSTRKKHDNNCIGNGVGIGRGMGSGVGSGVGSGKGTDSGNRNSFGDCSRQYHCWEDTGALWQSGSILPSSVEPRDSPLSFRDGCDSQRWQESDEDDDNEGDDIDDDDNNDEAGDFGDDTVDLEANPGQRQREARGEERKDREEEEEEEGEEEKEEEEEEAEDEEPDRVCRYHFVLAVLVHLGQIKLTDDVLPWLNRFTELDTTDCGYLTVELLRTDEEPCP